MSLDATRELAATLGLEPLALLRANRDRPWKYERGSLAFESLRVGDVLRHPNGTPIQIVPPGPGVLRMGAASNFDTYAKNPEFSAAWGEVQSQLTAEGQGPGSLTSLAAQQLFADTFDNITSALNIDSGTALAAASNYVRMGHTVLGAVNTVQQVVSAAQGGNPQQAFNLLTGAMVAAATASGVVTVGVGALITIGVGLTLQAMGALGLFGVPLSGTEWCPSLRTTGQIGVQVGCVITLGDPHRLSFQYGSPYWRRFPKPSGGNKNDAEWFNAQGVTPGGGFNNVDWAGSAQGPSTTWTSYGGMRLIDSAFPDWHYLMCNSIPANLQPFAQAFLVAWMANKEYELNGLKSQPDWQVLRTLVLVWNRAHDGSSYADVGPKTKPAVQTPVFANTQIGVPFDPARPTFNPPGCPSGLPPLFQTVIGDLIGQGSLNDAAFLSFYNASSNTIRIHTGPQLTPAVARKNIPLVLGPSKATAKPAPGLSTGEKVAVAGGLTVAAAGGAWWWLGKPLTVEAIKIALRHVFK